MKMRLRKNRRKKSCGCQRQKRGFRGNTLIRSGANLKNLHYAMQGMFGWQNRSAHFFSISDEEFNKLTAQRWGGYRDLCGVLFREPHHRQLPCVDGPKYAPRRSYRYYLLPLNKKRRNANTAFLHMTPNIYPANSVLI